MVGAVLPGNSTVELRDFPIPEPGTWPSINQNEIFDDLWQRYSRDLP